MKIQTLGETSLVEDVSIYMDNSFMEVVINLSERWVDYSLKSNADLLLRFEEHLPLDMRDIITVFIGTVKPCLILIQAESDQEKNFMRSSFPVTSTMEKEQIYLFAVTGELIKQLPLKARWIQIRSNSIFQNRK